MGLATGNVGVVRGDNMVDNQSMGAAIVPLTNTSSYTVAPSNVNKIYVYVSILPESGNADNIWGVHHSWNSAVLQKFGQNDEESPID